MGLNPSGTLELAIVAFRQGRLSGLIGGDPVGSSLDSSMTDSAD